MPRTIIGAHGLRRFQSPHPVGTALGRTTLQQLAEPPKIHVPDVKPGINHPPRPVESAAAMPMPSPEPVKVEAEVKPAKLRRTKPKPEPVVESESEEVEEEGTESGEEEEVVIEELPKPKRRAKSAPKQDTELASRFVAAKEAAPEPEKVKKPRKKKEVAEGVVKEKRPLTAWHLFMQEAKEWPEVKQQPGKERVKYISELYKKRKAELEAKAKELPAEKKDEEVVSL